MQQRLKHLQRPEQLALVAYDRLALVELSAAHTFPLPVALQDVEELYLSLILL